MRVQEIYNQYGAALQRFLLGVLRDDSAAADALQTTLTTLMEKGHLVQQQDSIKSWLFRVAFNEAMLIKRRNSTSRKHAEGIAWKMELTSRTGPGADGRLSHSVQHAIDQENTEQIRAALDRLPAKQRKVVHKRIYEGLKFREIAEELEVPLGTVLARMQAALKKLRPILSDFEFDE